MKLIPNGTMGTAYFADKMRTVKLLRLWKCNKLCTVEWTDVIGLRQETCLEVAQIEWDESDT